MITSFYILLSCFIHIFIWLFVSFSGFFNKNLIYLNFILLPIIFIVQSQSTHYLTEKKIRYILSHQNELSKPQQFISYCYNMIEPNEVRLLSNKLNVKEDDIINAFLILHNYEEQLYIPAIIRSCHRLFCDSYKNPFSAQGLIIFAFIFNTLALYIKH